MLVKQEIFKPGNFHPNIITVTTSFNYNDHTIHRFESRRI
jgi:hypothetical protein